MRTWSASCRRLSAYARACSFFFVIVFFPSLLLPSLPPHSSPLIFSSFPLTHSLFLTLMSAVESEHEDRIDLDGSDDDLDPPPHISAAKPAFCHPSMNTSASTSSLVTPSSSAISYPSGLSDDVIYRLTHNELLKNPEFVKYINTVDVLLHRDKVDKVPSNCKSSHLFFKPTLILHHSFPCHQFGWVIPSPRRFGISNLQQCQDTLVNS